MYNFAQASCKKSEISLCEIFLEADDKLLSIVGTQNPNCSARCEENTISHKNIPLHHFHLTET